ncbi:MAG: XRE family transcriptional regulator [Hyphomonas sp.]|uniref:helix-turn-helix domain-containing protein n=1 Tax=Hyphomonas sp. TaxID=87 RepID=UPI001D37DC6E|nr:helix-turn-helix transcriptional regulator [Hyphomonas sp.]MBA4227705.1 XRE family transcriptional regulator [Hyphomonas sp.]
MANSLADARYRRIIDRLREARLAASLTQAELAEKLGRPQSFVAKVEGYERRLDILEFVQLAASIDVEASELLDPDG